MSEQQQQDPRDEAELVRAIQAGEMEACGPLLDMHLDRVRAFIALKLPISHLVNEIAHETFVFALRHIDEFAAGTSFYSWLRAIASNLIRAELQRFAREQANQFNYAKHTLLERELTRPESADSAEVEFLRECVEQLPLPMRELLALKYREEDPTDVIARKLERTQTWVWQVLFRLRQQLRDCIQGKLGRPEVNE